MLYLVARDGGGGGGVRVVGGGMDSRMKRSGILVGIFD